MQYLEHERVILNQQKMQMIDHRALLNIGRTTGELPD